MKLLRAADRSAVPWKNGGGITREIAARPEGAGSADFGWRVSLAEVAADGPFSAFPGVDRVLTMVEGEGMDLTLEGVGPRRVDARFVPQRFPGDVPTGCRLLGGRVVNLNVMHRRGSSYAAEVEVVTGDVTTGGAPEPGSTRIVVPLDAGAVLRRRGDAPLELERYDALVFTDPAPPPALIRSEGRTAVLTLRHP
ncbi:HutD family protein [Streptomyces sp. NBC_00237]|uniref:HutD/Ves family protein n=1 Tax=Streptomyces sp. NBC_00237 TaxID=2975687 RepID=UPI00224C8453|nr:HutD family protein [Streptomyces sp. NBC_00237]MCX5201854.1 HutD family protein [Streptomyces sp. NBC_00237]